MLLQVLKSNIFKIILFKKSIYVISIAKYAHTITYSTIIVDNTTIDLLFITKRKKWIDPC